MRCTCEQAIRETWLEAAALCRKEQRLTTMLHDAARAAYEIIAIQCEARAAATLPTGGVKAPVRYTEAPEPETAPSGPQDGATWPHSFYHRPGEIACGRCGELIWHPRHAVTTAMDALTPIAAALDRAADRTAPGDARYWLRDGTGEQPGATTRDPWKTA